MNQWTYVIAAYALVVLATLGLVIASWTAMRRAEADAAAVPRQ